MIKLVIMLLCCGIYTFVSAQEKKPVSTAVVKIDQREKRNFQSTQDVADYMLSNYPTEKERMNGIYSWVTHNIRYDKTGTFALNAGPDKNAKIDIAFARRRGVCENFAAIFNDICHKAGFESYVVEGITRINNQGIDGGHSWVTAKINGEWYFFDPTWDEGGSLKYFMVSPEEFIASHIPFDPLWQFLEYPVTTGSKNKETKIRQTTVSFNYKDSLSAWTQMDSIQKLESVEKRILNAGIYNRNAQTNLSVVKMNLEIERQGEQVEWHNLATNGLNEAVATINQFIEFRNDLSLLLKPDGELKEMLRTARSKVDSSIVYLDKIDHSKAKLVMGTWPERERIVNLKNNLANQEKFLNQYVATAVAERKALFYQ